MTRPLAALATALIAWDALLHFVGLYWRDLGNAGELPWLLWPHFESLFLYDLFWLCLHAGAAAVLILQLRTR